MNSSNGLPPEILVLCTTAQTKDRALHLLRHLRSLPNVDYELAWGPPIPAVCSLLASEQLGSATVTERRALQWSQSTPEQFKATVIAVQKVLASSKLPDDPSEKKITLKSLADKFCLESHTVDRMLPIEKAYASGNLEWPVHSPLAQVIIFIWCCRHFKIPTIKSLDTLRQRHNLPNASEERITNFLDDQFLYSKNVDIQHNDRATGPHILHQTNSHSTPATSNDSSRTTSARENRENSEVVTLDALAQEVDLGEDVMKGLRFLDKAVQGMEEFENLVNWSSAMGRCTIFYWACSILKVSATKHIKLRQKYGLGKREFDKILWSLDSQRATLRKSLEDFYAANPALNLLPHGTKWAATSPANVNYAPPVPISSSLVKTAPSKGWRKGLTKRGRPPKEKYRSPFSLQPFSTQEKSLAALCSGTILKRALLLIRSFNAKHDEENLVSSETLPLLVTLLACRQLRDHTWDENKALALSLLSSNDFHSALKSVESIIDDHCNTEHVICQTIFDELALEHGLDINSVLSMAHVCQTLKDSRCLSDGMDWKSPLVQCTVFFWTCAFLSVPNINQNIFRARSQASKREFDSMLQLLNSHCGEIRQRLEAERRGKNSQMFSQVRIRNAKRSITDPSFSDSKRFKRESQTPLESELNDKPTLDSSSFQSKDDPHFCVSLSEGFPLASVNTAFDGRHLRQHSESLSPSVPYSCNLHIESPPNEAQNVSGPVFQLSRTRSSQETLDIPDPNAAEREARYHRWEEKMRSKYGSEWERNILEQSDVSFE